MAHSTAPVVKQAQTIDEVLAELGRIIDWAQNTSSRLGYFAALYRNVTSKVKQGIANGDFNDGPRMEKFDVIFANRYLQAFATWQSGETPMSCWDVAFKSESQWNLTVLQHLMLGMNAHINLDLGIAAAQTAPGDQLPDMESDFNKINEILAALIDEIENQLAEVWPILGWLDKIAGTLDERFVRFSMDKARAAAWSFAQELAPLDAKAQQDAILSADSAVATIGKIVRFPGITGSVVLTLVRFGERGGVSKIIGILK